MCEISNIIGALVAPPFFTGYIDLLTLKVGSLLFLTDGGTHPFWPLRKTEYGCLLISRKHTSMWHTMSILLLKNPRNIMRHTRDGARWWHRFSDGTLTTFLIKHTRQGHKHAQVQYISRCFVRFRDNLTQIKLINTHGVCLILKYELEGDRQMEKTSIRSNM